jgi:hypothetical protein
MSTPCVACTFKFLISVSPYLKLSTSGISLGGHAAKHRQLARQVGVRIKDPPANSMASFKFTSAVPPQGTTFIFGSWVCITDGTGDFHRFTIDVMKPKTLAASFHSVLDEFVDNLDDLSTHGSARKTKEESIFNATLQRPRSDRTHSNLRTCVTDHDSVYAIRPLNIRRPTIPSPSMHWKRTWAIYSKSENPKPPHIGGLRVALVTMV